MAKSYVQSKAQKKKSSKNLLFLIVVIGVIFLFVVIRFALGSGEAFSATGLPTNDDAYAVSQDFVRSTIRSNNIVFSTDGFQAGKRSDSVYVVRSSAELQDNGNTKNVSFKLLMEYKGGKHNDMKNWLLLNISEEQQ